MDNFHKNATGIIINLLKERLGRELTDEEFKAFSMSRSGIAYEMIIDYISDDRKTKEEIESYARNVVAEYQ